MNLRNSHRPVSVPELCDLVRSAAAEGDAIFPHGGRTMLDFGLPPSRPGIAVDLTALDQVIDYPARDMTITVQAGVNVARLQEILAKENQRLPIDVPLPEKATLGGAIACNVSGPRRYGFGTFRDYIIGISVVNDRGEEVKAGGRVVKNVAGYDLCKLYTGSLGTLGIITQVTLKVLPRPESSAVCSVGAKTTALAPLLERLHQSQTRPVCIELLNLARVRSLLMSMSSLEESTWAAFIGFEGKPGALQWQAQQFMKEMAEASHEMELRYMAFPNELRGRSFEALCTLPEARLSFKACLLPRAVAAFCDGANAMPAALKLQAHAGNGIVAGHAGPEIRLEDARAMFRELRRLAAEASGSLVLTRCPDEWISELNVWDEPCGDWELMRAVKRQLDPQNLFNPGRYVGGI